MIDAERTTRIATVGAVIYNYSKTNFIYKITYTALRVNPIVSLVLYIVAVVFIKVADYPYLDLPLLRKHKEIKQQF